MQERFIAVLSGLPPSPKVKHYRGFPPDLTHGLETRKQMGNPAFLVITQNENGAFLYRYDETGQCVGDTWHRSLEEAKDQASYEYKGFLKPWEAIPSEIDDLVPFGMARCHKS